MAKYYEKKQSETSAKTNLDCAIQIAIEILDCVIQIRQDSRSNGQNPFLWQNVENLIMIIYSKNNPKTNY